MGRRVAPSLVVKPARRRRCRAATAPSAARASSCRRYEPGTSVATRAAFGDALVAVGAAQPARGRARRRGVELDLHRRLRRGAPRPLLRDVHRRAADGLRRGRHAGARLDARSRRRSPRSSRARSTRSAWRPISRATLNLVGLARRRLDRRGRPLADGPRGPGDDARRARQRRALSVLRKRDREARRGDGRAPGHPVPAHDAREDACPLPGERALPHRRLQGPAPLGGATAPPSSRRASRCTRRSRRTTSSAGAASPTRVIDLYSVKPVDRATLHEAARECPGGLVVVEDHHPEGGLGDAVAEAFDGAAAPRSAASPCGPCPGRRRRTSSSAPRASTREPSSQRWHRRACERSAPLAPSRRARAGRMAHDRPVMPALVLGPEHAPRSE